MRKVSLLCGVLVMVVCMTVGFTQEVFADGGVKSVNHKGYNTVAPENTIPAFELSAEMGYQYVETDISFTKDGVPVLLHDPNINNMARNADGSELAQDDVRIDSLTYEETLRYDFTQGKTDYKGTKLARLDDFLDLCKEKGLHPYLELKENGAYAQDQISGLVDLVREKGMEGKVSWISFKPEYLQWVKAKDPEARLGFLGIVTDNKGVDEAIATAQDLQTGSNEVFLDLQNKTEFVTYDYDACRKAGLPVEIWLNDQMNVIVGITEREILEKLDPYVTGVTVDKHIYAKPSIAISPKSYIYNGEIMKPAATVSLDGETMAEGDYDLTYAKGCRNAGKYQVTAGLRKGILAGAATAEFTIKKAANPLKIKGKTAQVKAGVLKKKAKKLAVTRVIAFKTKGQGKMTYAKSSGNKMITINKTTGKVTLKKGLMKGKYKVKVKVRAAGNANYKSSDVMTITFTVIVK